MSFLTLWRRPAKLSIYPLGISGGFILCIMEDNGTFERQYVTKRSQQKVIFVYIQAWWRKRIINTSFRSRWSHLPRGELPLNRSHTTWCRCMQCCLRKADIWMDRECLLRTFSFLFRGQSCQLLGIVFKITHVCTWHGCSEWNPNNFIISRAGWLTPNAHSACAPNGVELKRNEDHKLGLGRSVLGRWRALEMQSRNIRRDLFAELLLQNVYM